MSEKDTNLFPLSESGMARSYNYGSDPGLFVNYTPYPPFLDADSLLNSVISRNSYEESIVMKRLSQTPLEPEYLYDSGMRYERIVSNNLEGRVYEAAMKIGLPEHFTEAVQLEVAEELKRRITGNSEAAGRLRVEIAGTVMTQEDADLIWRARTGDATLAETGRLLLQFPMMQSVEAAKYTEPFSPKIHKVMRKHILSGLGDIQNYIVEHPDSLSLEIYDENDERKNPHFMSIESGEEGDPRALLGCVMGMKESLAEVSDGSKTIQLVQKLSIIAVPNNIQLVNARPIMKDINGQRVQLLPNAISCYWRERKPPVAN